MCRKHVRRGYLSVIFYLALLFTLPACVSNPTPTISYPNTFQQSSIAIQNTPAVAGITASTDTFCPILQLPQIFDQKVYSIPLLTEPPARTSFHDPVFGSCLARISNHDTDLLPYDPSTGLRPESAVVQSFNYDSSLLLVHSTSWFWYIYATDTMQAVANLPFNKEVEIRWHPTVANRLYVLEDHQLYQYTIKTGEKQLVHDFANEFGQKFITWVGTNHIGSPSLDGRYWPLIATGANGQTVGLLVFDLVDNQVTSRYELPSGTSIEGLTISPKGNYLLAWYSRTCPTEVKGKTTLKDHSTCGLVVYDKHLQNERVLLPNAATGDVLVDSSGSEVFVFHNLSMNSLSMIDLKSGQQTDLWLIDRRKSPLGISISGRAALLPGWALISSYGGRSTGETGLNTVDGPGWMDNSIFAIELKSNGRVVRLANTFSLDSSEIHNEEWAGPQATPNQDFTRIVFSSNWGNPNAGQMDIYMIGLPSGWDSLIP